jgi:hypothetical protein
MKDIRDGSTEEVADVVFEDDERFLRRTLDDLPAWTQAATQHDEEYWEDQRRAIWSRISSAESRSSRPIPVLAWALAAAMIAISGWMVQRPLALPTQDVRVDPDHELLMEVERVVQTDGPLALEPAALLAEEMVQELPANNSQNHKKEPSHEN